MSYQTVKRTEHVSYLYSDINEHASSNVMRSSTFPPAVLDRYKYLKEKYINQIQILRYYISSLERRVLPVTH